MSKSKRPLNSPESNLPLVKKVLSFITSTPIAERKEEKLSESILSNSAERKEEKLSESVSSKISSQFETVSSSNSKMNGSLDQEMADANPTDYVSIEVENYH